MTAPTGGAPARVVYTAVMGGYEELQEQPLARSSSVRFVCFTDQPSLRRDDWELRLVEPTLAADSIRSSRVLKISGDPSLADFQETLWIDNRVQLASDPAELLDQWLAGSDVAVPRHSFRADVVSEFQAVLEAGLDDSARLYEQLTHYSALSPELLRHPVPWTGMLARRRSARVSAAMDRWVRHVLRYSRRDQLSFVQAMHEADTTWSSIELGNLRSPVHTWREPVGRSSRSTTFQVADALQPPIAALGELRLSFERTVADLVAAVQSREQTITDLEAALEDQRAAAGLVAQQNAELREQQAIDLAARNRLRLRIRKLRRKKLRLERELAGATPGWRRGRRA